MRVISATIFHSTWLLQSPLIFQAFQERPTVNTGQLLSMSQMQRESAIGAASDENPAPFVTIKYDMLGMII